jgi:putative solute:sodium symporter small subunit
MSANRGAGVRKRSGWNPTLAPHFNMCASACSIHRTKEETTMNHDSHGYWKATLSLLTRILVIWFLVSFGAGILFADWLNNFYLGGYPLGFWFAQQGSMYIFIILIFYYGKKMGEIDRKFDVHEE